MTTNQIKLRELDETKRSNRKQEELKDKDIKFKRQGKVIPALIGAASKFVKGNDPKWYTQYADLTKDAAQLSFMDPLGTRTDSPCISVLDGAGTFNRAPGLMVLPYMSTFGNMREVTDTANIVGTKLYSFVRHRNSGSRNYDIPDITQYLLAITSAVELVSVLRNMYGIARSFSVTNKYKGKPFLAQFGVKPDEVYENLADLRYRINQYTQRLNAFAIPGTFSYLTRHTWLNEHIWLDSPEESKAQAYMFLPVNYWYYNWKEARLESRKTPIDANNFNMYGEAIPTSNGPTAVQFTNGEWQQSKTLQDWYNILDQVITGLSLIEDVGIISGDILKAFGDSTFKIYSLDEDYVTSCEYNLEVLSQIHNITPYNVLFDSSSISDIKTADFTPTQKQLALKTMITQDINGINNGDYLVFAPEVIYSTDSSNDSPTIAWEKFIFNTAFKNNVIVDSIETIKPDAGQVLVMTRGTVIPEQITFVDSASSSSYSYLSFNSYGSEIFLYPYVVSISQVYMEVPNDTDDLNDYLYMIATWVCANNECFAVTGNGATWGNFTPMAVACFEFAPSLFNMYSWDGIATSYDTRTIRNGSNVSKYDLSRLHYVAINSLMYIPEIATPTKG